MSNRLADEKSPYLLQHKDNPVDWYPWGEEAFEAARTQDKPVFLSIGYATCHWCHVMEHESFEDEEVAALLNDTFISVKVDREERPDVDQVYMNVCQLVTGQGGWPLTILMTPDKQPFFAATYLPKRSRHGRMGMLDLVPRIAAAWRANRDEIEAASDDLVGAVERISGESLASEAPGEHWSRLAYEQLAQRYDAERGGFGAAPKFPSPHQLLFLLRYWKRTGEASALEMVTGTLDAMRRGGIFDHVGYGFHRYSTDAAWKLPHFEKMLYDQALLTLAYTEAYAATGHERFRETAESVIAYVTRDLRGSEGAFYSAEDADSEGREGTFYVWTLDELGAVLGPDDLDLATRVYGLEPEGNFEDEATRRRTGENLVYLPALLDDVARREGLSRAALDERLEAIRTTLFEHRTQRERPLLDDKILTDWNGLMIAALAVAARTFGEPAYMGAARAAADFVLRRLRRPDETLLHRYRDGDAGLQANLDDYTFLAWGLVELSQLTFDVAYLTAALELVEQLGTRFADEDQGAYYFTPSDGEQLLVRPKEAYDGALPSGNAVAAHVLVRLARLLARPELEEQALAIAGAFGEVVCRSPSGFCGMLMSLEGVWGPAREVVVAGPHAAPEAEAVLDLVRTGFEPHQVVLWREPGEPPILQHASWLEAYQPRGKAVTVYVCRNHACDRPASDLDQIRSLLATTTR